MLLPAVAQALCAAPGLDVTSIDRTAVHGGRVRPGRRAALSLARDALATLFASLHDPYLCLYSAAEDLLVPDELVLATPGGTRLVRYDFRAGARSTHHLTREGNALAPAG